MTIKDLVEQLHRFPDDAEVIVSQAHDSHISRVCSVGPLLAHGDDVVVIGTERP